MLPCGGLEAKPRPRSSKRASRPILVAHTVKGRTTEPILGRYELFHPDFLCSRRLHLHEKRKVSFAGGRTAHAGRLGSAPRAENPCARLQPIHASSRALPREKWSVGRRMHSSNHMHRASAPGSGRLDLSLAGRRASRRTRSQRVAVVVAHVAPALLRSSSMEVLERPSAQDPDKSGHECLNRGTATMSRSRATPTRGAGTPRGGVAVKDEKSGQGRTLGGATGQFR